MLCVFCSIKIIKQVANVYLLKSLISTSIIKHVLLTCTVEVFCHEVDINKWEIVCVVGIPKKNIDFFNVSID